VSAEAQDQDTAKPAAKDIKARNLDPEAEFIPGQKEAKCPSNAVFPNEASPIFSKKTLNW
jgi:hypothetical protein